MLRPPDGKLVDGVVVDHVGNGGEGSAELTQDVLTVWCLLDAHVHEPMGAPRKIFVLNVKNNKLIISRARQPLMSLTLNPLVFQLCSKEMDCLFKV